MRKHYTLTERPHFVQGQEAEVDFSCMFTDGPILKGRVIGKVLDHIVDYWIVDFGSKLTDLIHHEKLNYPYSAISVQHTFFLQPEGVILTEWIRNMAVIEDQSIPTAGDMP